MSEITEEIQKALEAATPGPWTHSRWAYGYIVTDYPLHDVVAAVAEYNEDGSVHKEFTERWQANRNLIANAPTWLLTLLEENERLTKLGSEAVREQEYAKGQAVKWNDEAVRLREELAEEKRHAALGWEKSNKWLEENGRLRAELDKSDREVISKGRELHELRTELAEKDKVLEWIRDAGTDYQSINKAREVLSQFKKGESTNVNG